MKIKNTEITPGILNSILAMATFLAILAGAFALYTRSYPRAILILLSNILWLMALLPTKLRTSILNLHLPLINFLPFVMILILVGISEVISLFEHPFRNTPGTNFTAIFSIGYLICGIVVLWQFWQAYQKG